MKLARWLGVLTLLLAWTAAAVEYANTGNVRWSLVAAGLFFAAVPFALTGNQRP